MRTLGKEVTAEEIQSAKDRIMSKKILRVIIYTWGWGGGQGTEKMTENRENTVVKEGNGRENDKVSEEEEGWFTVKWDQIG